MLQITISLLYFNCLPHTPLDGGDTPPEPTPLAASRLVNMASRVHYRRLLCYYRWLLRFLWRTLINN